MLILDGRRFIEAPFENEDELEQVVIENSDAIFGPSSIFLPTKKLISTAQGTGTLPDGYVIDVVAPSAPGTYVLELEPVFENVAWFSERNEGTTSRHTVRVEP